MGRQRKHIPNRGELRPEPLYTTHGVKRAIGWGREKLLMARKSGIVKVRFIGGIAHYKGCELMAWADHQAEIEANRMKQPVGAES